MPVTRACLLPLALLAVAAPLLAQAQSYSAYSYTPTREQKSPPPPQTTTTTTKATTVAVASVPETTAAATTTGEDSRYVNVNGTLRVYPASEATADLLKQFLIDTAKVKENELFVFASNTVSTTMVLQFGAVRVLEQNLIPFLTTLRVKATGAFNQPGVTVVAISLTHDSTELCPTSLTWQDALDTHNAGNSAKAIKDLHLMLECNSLKATGDEASEQFDADVYNVLGFIERERPNDPNLELSETYYKRALQLRPLHKGALGYLGELYLKTGREVLARSTKMRLEKFACPQDVAFEELAFLVGKFEEYGVSQSPSPTIVTIASSEFSIAANLVTMVPSIAQKLNDPAEAITAFLPTDMAFRGFAANIGYTMAATASPEQVAAFYFQALGMDGLTSVLLNHVAPGKVVMSTQLVNGMGIPTALSEEPEYEEPKVVIDGANVAINDGEGGGLPTILPSMYNLVASNGIIHGISYVMSSVPASPMPVPTPEPHTGGDEPLSPVKAEITLAGVTEATFNAGAFSAAVARIADIPPEEVVVLNMSEVAAAAVRRRVLLATELKVEFTMQAADLEDAKYFERSIATGIESGSLITAFREAGLEGVTAVSGLSFKLDEYVPPGEMPAPAPAPVPTPVPEPTTTTTTTTAKPDEEAKLVDVHLFSDAKCTTEWASGIPPKPHASVSSGSCFQIGVSSSEVMSVKLEVQPGDEVAHLGLDDTCGAAKVNAGLNCKLDHSECCVVSNEKGLVFAYKTMLHDHSSHDHGDHGHGTPATTPTSTTEHGHDHDHDGHDHGTPAATSTSTAASAKAPPPPASSGTVASALFAVAAVAAWA